MVITKKRAFERWVERSLQHLEREGQRQRRRSRSSRKGAPGWSGFHSPCSCDFGRSWVLLVVAGGCPLMWRSTTQAAPAALGAGPASSL